MRLTVGLLFVGDFIEMLAQSTQEDEPLPRQVPDELPHPVELLVVLLDPTGLDERSVRGVREHRVGQLSKPQLERSAEDVDVDVIQRVGPVPVQGLL